MGIVTVLRNIMTMLMPNKYDGTTCNYPFFRFPRGWGVGATRVVSPLDYEKLSAGTRETTLIWREPLPFPFTSASCDDLNPNFVVATRAYHCLKAWVYRECLPIGRPELCWHEGE
jgi:hypothetical protein